MEMIKNEFFHELHSFLEIKSIHELNEKTELKSLEEWDSMLILTIIAFIDQNFNQTIAAEKLNAIKTIGDLMQIIGISNFQ
jgi:acyl carrier protein